MLRALYHGAAMLYYGWALRGIHPAHPDAAHVQLRHLLHSLELQRWLRAGT